MCHELVVIALRLFCICKDIKQGNLLKCHGIKYLDTISTTLLQGTKEQLQEEKIRQQKLQDGYNFKWPNSKEAH